MDTDVEAEGSTLRLSTALPRLLYEAAKCAAKSDDTDPTKGHPTHTGRRKSHDDEDHPPPLPSSFKLQHCCVMKLLF